MVDTVPSGYLSIHEALGVLFREMFPDSNAHNLLTLPVLGSAEGTAATSRLEDGLRSGEVTASVLRGTGAIGRILVECWKDEKILWHGISRGRIRIEDEKKDLLILVDADDFRGWARREAKPAEKLAIKGPVDILSAKRPSDGSLARFVSKARARLRDQRMPDLTREEIENLLEKEFPASARTQRRTAAGVVAATRKRRRAALLSNRANELEDLRRFLRSAT